MLSCQLSKNVQYLSNTLLSCPYFIKQRPFSQKRNVLMSFFFKFPMRNPMLLCQYLVKKLPCQDYTIWWAKKVNRMSFFFLHFSRKNQCSHAHSLSKQRPISKNTLFLCPYFIKKRHFCMNTVLSCLFFQNLNDNSPAVMPIFGQKSSILSKLQYILVTTL